MSIFTPTNIQELQEMAMLLTGHNQRDAMNLIQVFAAFGDFFGGDLGRTWTQGYSLRGKPTLNADAMAGICRSSGLVRFIKTTRWDHLSCTMEVARTDEPADIVHSFTYTFDMAQAQGLTGNRNWRTMPMQMLRARCLTMALRAVFPDAVSGIYSADEIADNTNMSDDERTQITAQALGEEMSSQAPQAQRAPQPSRAPQPAPQPQRAPEPSRPPQPQPAPEPSRPPQPQPAPEVGKKPTPVKRFNNMADLARALEHHGISKSEAVDVANRLNVDLEAIDADERTEFFYSWLISSTIRNSRLQPNWWRDKGNSRATVKQLRDEFPTLPVDADSRDIGINLANPYFWEGLSVSAHLEDEESIEAGRQIMREIINGSEDVALLLQLSRL
jgi:hypothetical protein